MWVIRLKPKPWRTNASASTFLFSWPRRERGGATGALQPHGPRGGVGDWEVRAAVLQSAYGRGLVYASKAKCGQALGYYGGEAITLQEYSELHEDEGFEADP